MEASYIGLVLCFLVVATVYSSVGFGGGSSYLALLALFLPNFLEIKTTALLCNLVVVTGSTYLFYKEGLFRCKLFLPLVLCSVPAAFFGATIHLSQSLFFICLGAVLAFAGVLLILQFFFPLSDNPSENSGQEKMGLHVILGAGAGFVSGLVGIGGGILLSPALHLTRWAPPKTIAALASFFILVNSLAGLAGQVTSGTFKVDPAVLWPLLLAVLVGGQVGTRVSLKKLDPKTIKGLTGAFVLFIGLKLVFSYT